MQRVSRMQTKTRGGTPLPNEKSWFQFPAQPIMQHKHLHPSVSAAPQQVMTFNKYSCISLSCLVDYQFWNWSIDKIWYLITQGVVDLQVRIPPHQACPHEPSRVEPGGASGVKTGRTCSAVVKWTSKCSLTHHHAMKNSWRETFSVLL